MHSSSYDNMSKLLNKYITPEYLKDRLNPILVDFGSAIAAGQASKNKQTVEVYVKNLLNGKND